MKKIKYLMTGVFILLFAFIFKINIVKAACSISVSAPSTSVVGQSFKVSVSVPSNAGAWEYTLSYDSSKVKLVSGQLKVVGVTGDSKTNTYTFTSLTSGVASFKAVNASILDYSSESECFSGSGVASVNMKSQAEIEASYSKNNNLSSLLVEGAELSPAFNKNTLEYTAELPPDTTKAKVVATPEDSKSSITGAGEIDVVDGLNKIEVTVTAQHGEKKTYVINLIVKELDPITVKVSGKKYTIVRKKGLVENIPTGFVESSIKIKGQDVVSYKSDIAKLTLVALKDEKGNISLFIYDKGKYTLFNDAKSSELNLLILDLKKAPLGYVKTSFKYNGSNIKAYKLFKSNSGYYLVYAMNLENGKKDYYLYDKNNNTFQVSDSYTLNVIKYLVYITFMLVLLSIFTILLKILKKVFTSKDKKIRKLEKKLNKLKSSDFEEENYDIESVYEKPVITEIGNDEYNVPKKSRKERQKELNEAKERLKKEKLKYRRVSLEDDD